MTNDERQSRDLADMRTARINEAQARMCSLVRKHTCGDDCDLRLSTCPRCYREGSRGALCSCHNFTADEMREIRRICEEMIPA